MGNPKTEQEILEQCDAICKEMSDALGAQWDANSNIYQEDLYFWLPTTVNNGNIKDYKYIFISPTETLTSSTGAVYGGNYGAYGSTTSKSVNPSDVIVGILSKEGFIIVPELKPELADETLIVNYGESGRRNRGLGYTIEVTIQFISAKSHTLICSGTAEGQGETEADDIRQAITRSLSAVLAR